MPQINHYEVTVMTRFTVDGPLAHHAAAQLAEARTEKALKGDGPAHSDPVKSARITSVAVDDLTFGARPAGGGKR